MAIGFLAVLAIVVPLVFFVFWLFFKWLMSSQESGNDQERKRIMEMVDSGKINSEEAAELLDAMGKSSALRGQQKFSRIDMTILVGVILVLLGFFMPWTYIGRRMYQSGSQVGAIGWVIFVIAVLSAMSVFITPKELLYKVSMLQIFLVLLGIALLVSVMIRGGVQVGEWVCLLGFILSLIASTIKFKKLAA